MQRKIEARTRGELFVERVAWNAAAGAALAVMVLFLLLSLHWLDQLTPHPAVGPSADAATAMPAQLGRPVANAEDRATEAVAVNRPSG